ncbi:MAG: hypothetical protein R2801_09550 [Chitinophagales bacterium]
MNQILTVKYILLKNATHTFGGKHPFEDEVLPTHSKQLIEETITFLISN